MSNGDPKPRMPGGLVRPLGNNQVEYAQTDLVNEAVVDQCGPQGFCTSR